MRYFKTDRFIVSYSLARRNVNAFLQLQPGTKSNTHRLKRNYRDQLFSFDNSIAASRWQYSTILKETALTTLLFIISIKHFISHQNTLYPQVLKFTILSHYNSAIFNVHVPFIFLSRRRNQSKICSSIWLN